MKNCFEHSKALYTKHDQTWGSSLSCASTVLDQEALKELQSLEQKGLQAQTGAACCKLLAF